MTFEQWWAVYREDIDLTYEAGVKIIAANAWCGAVAAERERCALVAEATETERVLCGGEDGSYWESDASATRAAVARNIRATPPTESAPASTGS